MSTRKLSNYDRATIVEWYSDGLYSQRELGEIYGVSRSTIRRVIEDDRNFCGRADRPAFSYVGQPSSCESGLYDGPMGIMTGPPEDGYRPTDDGEWHEPSLKHFMSKNFAGIVAVALILLVSAVGATLWHAFYG